MLYHLDMLSGVAIVLLIYGPLRLNHCTCFGIVYLLLMYGANTHKACRSDLVYLVTRNPLTLLLGHEWTYVAVVHSSSHQAMTGAFDQLHTTSFCSPPVLGNTLDTCNKRDA
jgi:hypothetical protein